MPALVTTCHILLAVVFAASAAGKARGGGFAAFLGTLTAMGLGRPRSRRALARLTVVAEAVAAVLLFLPGTRPGRAGLLLAVLLLTALTLGVARVVAGGGPPVACACFGRTGRPLGVLHLVRNAVLLLAALGALTASALRPAGGAPVVAVATGTVLAVVVIGLDDLADLFTPPAAPAPRTPAAVPGPPGLPDDPTRHAR